MTKSLVAAQERNLQFIQTAFTNTMELLESHVEATRALLQEVEQQAVWQQVAPRGMGSRRVEAYLGLLRGGAAWLSDSTFLPWPLACPVALQFRESWGDLQSATR